MTALIIWLRLHWRPVLLLIVVLALAAFAFCRPKPTPIPRPEQKTIDSLDATKPHADSVQQGTQQAITNVVTKIVHDDAALRKVRADADSARRRADSLAAAAQVSGDSAKLWHQAYEQRTAEAQQLRVAVDTLTRDLSAATDSLERAAKQIRADSTRQAKADDLNARLAKDLERASPPCRIGPFGCPSRKLVAVVGAGVAVVAAGVGYTLAKR